VGFRFRPLCPRGKKRHWIESLVVPRTGLRPFLQKTLHLSRGPKPRLTNCSLNINDGAIPDIFVACTETSLWLVAREVCGLYRDIFVACTETSLWLVAREVCGLYRDKFVACSETGLWLVPRQVCGL
jgi:hypothetical protein